MCFKEKFSKITVNLESTTEQISRLREHETSLASQQNSLEDEVKKKNLIIEDLETKMEIIRQENEAHLKQMVRTAYDV